MWGCCVKGRIRDEESTYGETFCFSYLIGFAFWLDSAFQAISRSRVYLSKARPPNTRREAWNRCALNASCTCWVGPNFTSSPHSFVMVSREWYTILVCPWLWLCHDCGAVDSLRWTCLDHRRHLQVKSLLAFPEHVWFRTHFVHDTQYARRSC